MIGIFKTNVATSEASRALIQAISTSFPVGNCNVDLEDCDKVLRIADLGVEEQVIIAFVRKQGFICDILD
ncbi:hypothetical protein DVR12_05155 [Chitinophaga silvatica]|uniref:Uncharacterized protein n=1 Tax=Chitinophaga silvatica TaxID=2282649 RepID=A0A3E1YDH1_9BACT|nr:hypothetical protein [Chitinophaga silvatica]RFS24595.1 hypothetical protein DVR12_05155 [Chitinophaga silvatica]